MDKELKKYMEQHAGQAQEPNIVNPKYKSYEYQIPY
jgi:hypothetical protein